MVQAGGMNVGAVLEDAIRRGEASAGAARAVSEGRTDAQKGTARLVGIHIPLRENKLTTANNRLVKGRMVIGPQAYKQEGLDRDEFRDSIKSFELYVFPSKLQLDSSGRTESVKLGSFKKDAPTLFECGTCGDSTVLTNNDLFQLKKKKGEEAPKCRCGTSMSRVPGARPEGELRQRDMEEMWQAWTNLQSPEGRNGMLHLPRIWVAYQMGSEPNEWAPEAEDWVAKQLLIRAVKQGHTIRPSSIVASTGGKDAIGTMVEGTLNHVNEPGGLSVGWLQPNKETTGVTPVGGVTYNLFARPRNRSRGAGRTTFLDL